MGGDLETISGKTVFIVKDWQEFIDGDTSWLRFDVLTEEEEKALIALAYRNDLTAVVIHWPPEKEDTEE